METRISSKGQITLPVTVRKKLKIKTGDILKVEITEEGKIILTGQEEVFKNEPLKALDVLHKTAGIWGNMEETGEEFVHRLRSEDIKRWKVLGLE